jgi:hypothetical protein
LAAPRLGKAMAMHLPLHTLTLSLDGIPCVAPGEA